MIGIPERAELSFEQDLLALFQSPVQELRAVAEVGADSFSHFHQLSHELVNFQIGLVVEVLQKGVLLGNGGLEPFLEPRSIEEIRSLNTYLQILVSIEGSDSAFCRAKFAIRQTLFFILVEEKVIGHDDLRSIGDQDLGLRHVSRKKLLSLGQEGFHIHRDTCAEDVGHILIEYSGWEQMKGELAEVIDYRVTGILAALKSHHKR